MNNTRRRGAEEFTAEARRNAERRRKEAIYLPFILRALGASAVRFLCALAFVLAAGAAEKARADEIRLKTGGRVEGEILSSDTLRIMIRTEGGELGIRRELTSEIRLDSGAERLVRRGFLDMLSGKMIEGLQTWQEALEKDLPRAESLLDRILTERRAEILEAAAKLPKEDSAKAAAAFEALARRESLSMDARFLCLRVLDRLGEWTEARRILAAIPLASIQTDAPRREFAAGFWREETKRKMAVRDSAAALEAIERMQQLDPQGGRSRRALFLLAQIGEARRRGNPIEALRIDAEQLLPLLPEVARQRASVLLEDIVRWTSAPGAPEGRFAEARASLEGPLGAAFPVEAQGALERLLAGEGRRLLDEGRTTDTLALLAGAPQTAHSEVLGALAFDAEFLARQAALAPGDPLAVFHLAQWALERRRLDKALPLLRQCLASETLRPLAEKQIALARGQIEAQALQRAIDLQKAGRPFDALDALDPILKREPDTPAVVSDQSDKADTSEKPDKPGKSESPTPSAFRESASRLADIIRSTLTDESKKRPYQAEVVFQQAERAFFAGEYATALERLSETLRDYADTPAAERAAKLIPRVFLAIRLEQMEEPGKPFPPIPGDLRDRMTQPPAELDGELRALLDEIEATSPTPPPPRVDLGFPK